MKQLKNILEGLLAGEDETIKSGNKIAKIAAYCETPEGMVDLIKLFETKYEKYKCNVKKINHKIGNTITKCKAIVDNDFDEAGKYFILEEEIYYNARPENNNKPKAYTIRLANKGYTGRYVLTSEYKVGRYTKGVTFFTKFFPDFDKVIGVYKVPNDLKWLYTYIEKGK